MRKINSEFPYIIGSYSINELINQIDEVKEDAEISWNSLGGSVWAGQQFIDFLNNLENKLDANVTGIAASMGASILPFFNRVKGAAQSDLMLHSVSGGANVRQSNEFLYKSLAKKINEDTFEKITGYKLKDVMTAEGEKRFEVWFTGKDAKKMGLYDEVYDLLQAKNNSIASFHVNELGYEFPESVKEKLGLIKTKEEIKKTQLLKLEQSIKRDKEKLAELIKTKDKFKSDNDMEIKDVTASALLAGNPEVYNSIIAIGQKAEQNRVAEIMNYGQFDLVKANELIKSGAKLELKDVEYFMEKKFNAKKIADLEENSADDFVPAKETKNKEEKEKEAAFQELRDKTGVNEILNKK